MNTLWQYFQTNQGRLVHKWAHYFPIYERHFSRFINRPNLMIEIGCGKGGSLQMWKSYFGPHVQIVGIDINPDCKAFEEDQVAIRIGNQSDLGFLQSVIEEFGVPEMVVDDGSHAMDDIRATFGKLYPMVQKDGVYLVEDLHTAYWPQTGGGLRHPNSFIEDCKSLVDEINGHYTEGGALVTEFTRSTMSMHFYDSVVVFEKGRIAAPRTMGSEKGRVFPH